MDSLAQTIVVRRWHERAARNLALQDQVVLVYHAYLWLLASTVARGPLAHDARLNMSALLAWVLISLALTRGELLPQGPLRSLVYRFGIYGSTAVSYFALRPLLYALDPHGLDAQLLAIDRTLFGQSPAEWLDAFVSARSVEWFSFFYYSYYGLLALFIGGSLLLDDGRRRYEVLLAATLVIAVGHIGYTLVPGVGPCAWPELSFEHALVGGDWWRRVNGLVSAAGAQLDIFPSLHTGLSLCVGLHVLRHRNAPLFRFVWPIIVFFVVNIVVATMFLRWHYGIDVIVGALLAVAAQRIAIVTFRREGERVGRQAVWEPVEAARCYAAPYVRGRAHTLERCGHDRPRAALAGARAGAGALRCAPQAGRTDARDPAQQPRERARSSTGRELAKARSRRSHM